MLIENVLLSLLSSSLILGISARGYGMDTANRLNDPSCTGHGPWATITATQATGTSAPIAGRGPQHQPNCSHLWANNPEEDWLFASLCSWAQSNPNWVLSHLDWALDFKDFNDTPAMNFSTYDDSLNLLNPLTISYQGVNKDGNSNPNDAWWGGGFRNALLSNGYSTVDEKNNFRNGSSEDANGSVRDWAGYWALQHLIGLSATREKADQINEVIWDMWLQKSDHSPITILTSPTTTCLNRNRYYSITRNDPTNDNIVLWDPTVGGAAGYVVLDSKQLKKDTLWLFHLDWPRYSDKPRKSQSVLN
ncbi:uncharacterized protein IL334_000077 [Kwoniella shivajii]|uniref:Uncharacterized protein n=1 Tax=Kwoniella shivajii TaxID=564305 RepID=A0ABZ1CN49_9TREE|nr:hypothetical protein IL334_000077 [Kwoniella shivajii]